MTEEQAKILLERYRAGLCTDEERLIVESWIEKELSENQWDKSAEERTAFGASLKQRIDAVKDIEAEQAGRIRPLWPRIAAAASIIIALSVGSYFALHKKAAQPIAQLKPGTFKNDALPGNKAILTLANGKQLAVTAIPTGKINNTNIQKTNNGELVYKQSDTVTDAYNTLTVPRGGGKHELRLADGTLVILDAGSSIRFPVAFHGVSRKVSITGQAYFEVVHKTSQPFYVTVNNQTIEDIGTHFNINAFDGPTKTTLLEGAIKVNNTLLKPGQQAIQQPNGQLRLISNVDEEEVIAWKNGLFKFGDDATLEVVMSQLSRWYDLDIVYEGQPKVHSFGGIVSRDLKLSSVCRILAISGVQFSLDGKKLIVYQ